MVLHHFCSHLLKRDRCESQLNDCDVERGKKKIEISSIRFPATFNRFSSHQLSRGNDEMHEIPSLCTYTYTFRWHLNGILCQTCRELQWQLPYFPHRLCQLCICLFITFYMCSIIWHVMKILNIQFLIDDAEFKPPTRISK